MKLRKITRSCGKKPGSRGQHQQKQPWQRLTPPAYPQAKLMKSHRIAVLSKGKVPFSFFRTLHTSRKFFCRRAVSCRRAVKLLFPVFRAKNSTAEDFLATYLTLSVLSLGNFFGHKNLFPSLLLLSPAKPASSKYLGCAHDGYKREQKP